VSPDEVRRLQDVYRQYAEDDLTETRWGLGNRGNRAIRAERDRVQRDLLSTHGLLPLLEREILEVGCGTGHVLASLVELGAKRKRLHGVELLEPRVEQARRDHPWLDVVQANAEHMPYEDESFDVVLLYIVFSSILDPDMRANVARECVRVLRPRGHVLWYDFRYDNPSNPNVRGMRREELERLFPEFELSTRTLTLVPQVARRLGPLTGVLYPVLAAVPPLRTYYMALLRKP
jgi:ubiquinone/menaquinone biosynthesis C-methylase UbiE